MVVEVPGILIYLAENTIVQPEYNSVYDLKLAKTSMWSCGCWACVPIYLILLSAGVGLCTSVDEAFTLMQVDFPANLKSYILLRSVHSV